MNARWKIRDFRPGEGLAEGAATGSGEGWIAARVPGDTYTALIAAGRLSHPFKDRNEAAAEWVRDREWWWHTILDVPSPNPDDDPELVFDGLDTFADIYLDGICVGHADNMFRSWRYPLPAGATDKHHLAVCFHPPTAMVAGAPLKTWSTFPDRISRSRRPLMRKAQFGWGWDWAPDLPTVGIWKPVRLERQTRGMVRSLNATTRSISDDLALLDVDIDLSSPEAVAISLLDPQGINVANASRHGSGRVTLSVEEPCLWWTADLGGQPLYTIVAHIAGKPDFRRRIGIRTIALDQSPDPDEPGTNFFRFLINGVPIFAKGACWVPADSFVGSIADQTYRDLIGRAVDANMNMLRIWGGGIYEADIFYDACDESGLLVWQDFMFACAPCPDTDPAFVENVRAEIIEQVSRLRHHPSIALWCGNNENQAMQFFDDRATGRTTLLEGLRIYDELMPQLLSTLDPGRPYWPGSPSGGPSPNSMRGGDVHDWTVWHGVPPVPDTEPVGEFNTASASIAYTRYNEDMARFVSEFGIQGAPDIGTLKRWMAPQDMAPGSAGLLGRIKDDTDKAAAMMAPVTGAPTTIEDYVDFTMLTQAEGLKFGIEHFRRRRPHCSGALIWQHNDCWPCVSWSLVDYDGVAKAAWYSVARAFFPVLASFRRCGDAVELWITSDLPAPVHDTINIAYATMDGEIVPLARVDVEVGGLTSICVWRGPASDCVDRVLIVRSEGNHFPANRLLLAAVKDLALAPDPGLTVACSNTGKTLEVRIAAVRYALGIHLRADDPAIRMDDNYFDLAGGECRTVRITHRDGADVAPDAITIASWNDRRASAIKGA
ncbi:hypothetical protein KY084_03455 [Stakelama sp. CBK3Z-3]|uniref:Glycoside hydrolase family 2 protein n=1 Tax=Stakelama flava TaxID=2860338 RepID=A0ABS6XIG7_9SPHN|nr:glycoside hydrolase family 2 protein [Stakelama flava]MBW4329931.1 hypothetical protein [Stakelama flava]